ncbi:hypothetical protein OF83DRAFT_1080861 [Amylostereum chailletii]|nr:hypothetical protein OF83DRAFT_1080861 [Amylostereum chailletii]
MPSTPDGSPPPYAEIADAREAVFPALSVTSTDPPCYIVSSSYDALSSPLSDNPIHNADGSMNDTDSQNNTDGQSSSKPSSNQEDTSSRDEGYTGDDTDSRSSEDSGGHNKGYTPRGKFSVNVVLFCPGSSNREIRLGLVVHSTRLYAENNPILTYYIDLHPPRSPKESSFERFTRGEYPGKIGVEMTLLTVQGRSRYRAIFPQFLKSNKEHQKVVCALSWRGSVRLVRERE